MKGIFEFEGGEGILFDMGPGTKLVLLLIVWAFALIFGFFAQVAVFFAIIILAAQSGVLGKFTHETKWFWIMTVPMILVIQVLFTGGQVNSMDPGIISFAPNFSMNALVAGLTSALRLFCLFGSSVLFSMTTNPLAFAKRLGEVKVFGRGLPQGLIFLFIFINRASALVFADIEGIREAQKARGLDLGEESVLGKIKGYVALLIPLLTISFERAEKQAVALEIKGFGLKDVPE